MRHGRILSLIFVISTLGSGASAWAFPMTMQRLADPQIMFDDGFHTSGIVALPNCSASLVKFKGASDDNRALLLTNGHCSGGLFGGMPEPGEVFYRKSQRGTASLLNERGSKILGLKSDMIVYATMTDTDVAIFQLSQTYREIETATGVKPLMLADTHPVAGAPIEIPSGYWKRTYSCQIDGFTTFLKESNWTFKDSIRYSASGCDVIGGTSGSPLFSPLTKEVIGINNTVNEGAQACALNNPCEVDAGGKVTSIKDRGYGQETYILYTCLDASRQLDLSVPGCVLPKP